jgi:hypothetical protein
MRPKIKFSQMTTLNLTVGKDNKTLEITFLDDENVKIESGRKIPIISPAVSDTFQAGGDIISILESYLNYVRTGQEYEEYQTTLDDFQNGSTSVFP